MGMPKDDQELAGLIHEYTVKTQRDLYVFSASLSGWQENNKVDQFIDLVLAKPNRQSRAAVFLTTYGGDPDDAFRMARCLRKNYDSFRLLVAGPCKSAGTIIALGASEIAIGPTGELGPLDVQMAKPDELLGSGSGLDIFTALTILTSQAFDRFEEYMLELTQSSGGSISTRTASDIAVKLITGLLNPIAAHIDPIRLGEAQRAIDIAKAYGQALGLENLKSGALETLVSGYPSHSFVIDSLQAKKLFNQVGDLENGEIEIATKLKRYVRYPVAKLGAIFDASVQFPLKEAPHEQPTTRGGAANSTADGGGVAREEKGSRRPPKRAPESTDGTEQPVDTRA
jgi:hypothetical protein